MSGHTPVAIELIAGPLSVGAMSVPKMRVGARNPSPASRSSTGVEDSVRQSKRTPSRRTTSALRLLLPSGPGGSSSGSRSPFCMAGVYQFTPTNRRRRARASIAASPTELGAHLRFARWRPTTFRLAFAQAAAAGRHPARGESFDWLCEQGHVGLERVAKARRDATLVRPVTAALELLGKIYARLKGDVSVLYASRENLLLPVDLVHAPTGTVIEVDGSEHFTSFRLAALELYPVDVDRRVRPRRAQASCAAPGARRPTALGRGLAAKGFGFGGGQRERAYHDALRDLATPAMGHPPLVRIAAVDGDGAGAYRRNRSSLLGCS